MQNQLCRVCDEPAAGFHFGAFTCEGCKSFFGRTSNNQSVIQECKNNYQCVINKKNRTACKACRLRKCLMVGMSKSGSRYGRRSNWFKIHCLMQQAAGQGSQPPATASSPAPLPQQPPLPNLPPALRPPSPPPAGLWRPQDVPSPRSVHSEPAKFSPSQSPVSQNSDIERSISNTILNLRPVKDDDAKSEEGNREAQLGALGGEHWQNDELHIWLFQGQFRGSKLMLTNYDTDFPFAGLASLYPAAGHLPPTFNFPALAGLPLHKQGKNTSILFQCLEK